LKKSAKTSVVFNQKSGKLYFATKMYYLHKIMEMKNCSNILKTVFLIGVPRNLDLKGIEVKGI